MDLGDIPDILRDLRLANEVEAAADLDVLDAEAHVEFYSRKLEAMKARRDEARDATQEVCDRLGEAVTLATLAPLTLMTEVIEHRGE